MPRPLALLLLALCFSPAVPAAAAQQNATYNERLEWWSRAPDGCSLYVAEFGRGTPLLVIHGGFGGEHSYLIDAVEWLSPERHLVMYDQRGSLRSPYQVYQSGGSYPCPDSSLTISHHVQDIERLREQLGVERIDLLGHSMGTFLAMAYLAAYPHRVGRLLLVSPVDPATPATPGDSALAQGQRVAANALYQRPGIDSIKRAAGIPEKPTTDRDVFAEWRFRFATASLYHLDRWRQLRGGMAFHNSHVGNTTFRTMPARYNFVDDLRRHGHGTFVIMGDHDFLDLGARRWRLWARDGGATLHVVRKAGHNLWIDQPEEFRRLVQEALR